MKPHSRCFLPVTVMVFIKWPKSYSVEFDYGELEEVLNAGFNKYTHPF